MSGDVIATSLSSRRAWIEIETWWGDEVTPRVALLAEGVDRNILITPIYKTRSVALLAEGVDRNHQGRAGMEASCPSLSSRRAWIEILHTGKSCHSFCVALLAEGVDRNM